MAQISINLSCEKLKGSSDSIIIPRIAPSLYAICICFCLCVWGGLTFMTLTDCCVLVFDSTWPRWWNEFDLKMLYNLWLTIFRADGPNATLPSLPSLGWLYNCIYWGKGSRICIWTVVISVCRRARRLQNLWAAHVKLIREVFFSVFCCCCCCCWGVKNSRHDAQFFPTFLLFLKCVTLLLAFVFLFFLFPHVVSSAL